MAKAKIRGLTELMRDLEKFCSRKAIHEHLAEHNGETLIRVVISSAEAGIGPGNKPYPPYSESYAQQIGLRPRTGRSAGWSRKSAQSSLATGKGGNARLHKAIGAGNKRWLRGVGNTGQSGGMLDAANFRFETEESGALWLVWDGPADQAVYARVHQGSGTGEGGQDHTKGQIPPRPFLHFENSANIAALITAYRQTIEQMAAQVSAGKTP